MHPPVVCPLTLLLAASVVACTAAPPKSTATAATATAVDSASPSVSAPQRSRSGQPFVRAVKWLCDDDDLTCEGHPKFAYDYLPAVSADGEHIAVVEERDGWGHTREPGVRIVSSATGASEAFFPLVAKVDLHARLEDKSAYEVLIRTANAGLAQHDFKALYPVSEAPSSEDKVKVLRGPSAEVVLSSRSAAPKAGFDEIGIQSGSTKVRAAAKDWDPKDGCSKRAFRLVGVRADVKIAVFVSEIVMTGHDCDGVAELQPWAVRTVRW